MSKLNDFIRTGNNDISTAVVMATIHNNVVFLAKYIKKSKGDE